MEYAARSFVAFLLLSACSADVETRTSGGAPIQGDSKDDGGGGSGGQSGANGDAGASSGNNAGASSGVPDAGQPGAKVDAGGSSGGPGVPTEEVCDNGRDDDLDGLVDENCLCKAGSMQACYFGPPESAGQICPAGIQNCRGSEFAAWGPCESTGAPFPADACQCFPEVCGNDKDDNCNAQVDEGCLVMVPVDIDGDCVRAACPAWAPYPVGCNLVMDGGDNRGCVASTVTGSEVYFQEGNVCGAGHVMGTLTCSSQPGAPLDQQNCALNKSKKFFVQNPDDCP